MVASRLQEILSDFAVVRLQMSLEPGMFFFVIWYEVSNEIWLMEVI